MRADFLSDPQVLELVQWLSQRLPKLRVRLDIPHSSFVPNGLRVETGFAQLLPAHFRWRLTGMATGDWRETLGRLRMLAIPLRQGVLRNDAPATLAACRDIADWSADRNARVGAVAFLQGLGEELPAYLKRVRRAMRLSAPDPSGRFRDIPRMNSTLCKIHSLYAVDGLPIYESRIAVAMAVLVEAWRRESGYSNLPLPPALRFPAVGALDHRRVRRAFPHAIDPGTLAYASGSETTTAGRWADAAVRLGLLMGATLQRSDPLLCVSWPADPLAHHMAARMAAFTATLFMVGYDPLCLDLRASTSVRDGSGWVRDGARLQE